MVMMVMRVQVMVMRVQVMVMRVIHQINMITNKVIHQINMITNKVIPQINMMILNITIPTNNTLLLPSSPIPLPSHSFHQQSIPPTQSKTPPFSRDKIERTLPTKPSLFPTWFLALFLSKISLFLSKTRPFMAALSIADYHPLPWRLWMKDPFLPFQRIRRRN